MGILTLNAQENLVINGDFSAPPAGWKIFVADWDGVSVDVSTMNGEAKLSNIVNPGADAWRVQLIQELNDAQKAALGEGGTFIYSFDARADAEKTLFIHLGEDGGGWTNLIPEANAQRQLNLTTEIQSYSIEITGQSFAAMKLSFEGGHSAPGYSISNVRLVKKDVVDAPNLIVNGDFSAPPAGWTSYIHEGVSATFHSFDGMAVISDIQNAGPDGWTVQLIQVLNDAQKEALSSGFYILSFDAIAEANKSGWVHLGEDGGSWTNLLPSDKRSLSLTPELQSYSIGFNAQSFANMKLGFEGGFDNTSFAISNVSILPGNQPQPILGVIDNSLIANPDDLSGNFTVGWDSDSIYVFVEVKDDVLHGTSSPAYVNDNICIYIDLFNNKTAAYDFPTQLYWEQNWYDEVLGGRIGANWGNLESLGANIDVAVDTGSVYTITLAAPWSNIDSEYVPAVGDTIGFDIKLSDNDGQGRKQLAWSDITDGGWNNPSVFGEIELAEDGLVRYLTNRPAAPVITLSADQDAVTIGWTAVADAATYNVFRGNTLVAENISNRTASDVVPVSNTYTYRVVALNADSVALNQSLKSIDVEFTSSPSLAFDKTLQVFPNPASVEVRLSSSLTINSVRLLDISGREVKRLGGINSNEIRLPLINVNAGMYIIAVESDGIVTTRRLMVR